MATYKLNIAKVKGCPPAAKLLKLIAAYGLPEGEEFGVLNCSGSDQAVFATIIRKTQQAVQTLDTEAQELTSSAVERVTCYPIGIRPESETLEVYAGSAAGIEQIGVFLAGCLALSVVVEPIDVDVPAAVEKLSQLKRFQLKNIRVSDYAHNSYMSGPYTPKFLDSDHGKEFLAEYAAAVQSASVKFSAQTGRVSLKIVPQACFSYSCNEEDQTGVQSILRKLL